MYTIYLTEVGGGQNLTKLFKNGYLTTSCLSSHHGKGAYLIANKKFFCNTLLGPLHPLCTPLQISCHASMARYETLMQSSEELATRWSQINIGITVEA